MTPTQALILAHAQHAAPATRAELLAVSQDPDLGPVARCALQAGPASAAWLTASRALAEREIARRLDLETGTAGDGGTMPCHHWSHSVLRWAQVDDGDARRLAGAELHAWMRAGVSVREAACLLAQLVRRRLVAERSERDRTGTKAVLRAARLGRPLVNG